MGGLRSRGAAWHDSLSLLLAGVMVTAFCSAVVMLLVSMVQGPELAAVMHWFMGELGAATPGQAVLLACVCSLAPTNGSSSRPACCSGHLNITWCDLLARCLPTQGELPTGVVTALIGATSFIVLLRRRP